jgi:DNA-binding transcriptional LysR family regulator
VASAASASKPVAKSPYAAELTKLSGRPWPTTPWSFVEDGRSVEMLVSGPLIANDFLTMLGAAIEGVGLAQLPGPVAAKALAEGTLVQVLEPYAPTAPGVFLYYPSRRQMLPKLRAFVEHVKAWSAANAASAASAAGNTR